MEHRITPTVRLIRSAVLSGYVDVAKSVGLEPYGMVARRNLPPACLTDPEVKVSAVAVVRLLEESAQRSDLGHDVGVARRRPEVNIAHFCTDGTGEWFYPRGRFQG